MIWIMLSNFETFDLYLRVNYGCEPEYYWPEQKTNKQTKKKQTKSF